MTPQMRPFSHSPHEPLSETAIADAADHAILQQGPVTPFETLANASGAKTLKALTDNEGDPLLAYTLHPNGTITFRLQHQPHSGLATGTDFNLTTLLTSKFEQLITTYLAASSHSQDLAACLIQHDAASRTAQRIKKHAENAAARSLSYPPDHPDPPPYLSELSEQLRLHLKNEILDPEIKALCKGARNLEQLDLDRYNQLALHKDQLLALAKERPNQLIYYVTYVYRPAAEGPPPPTTSQTLTARLADALSLNAKATDVMARGLEQGRWMRRNPPHIALICQWAGLIQTQEPRPTTLDTLDTLRERLPNPNPLLAGLPQHTTPDTLGNLQYWRAILTIFDRDHDPSQYPTDLQWLRKHLTTTKKSWRTPQTPDPATTTWQTLRAQAP